MLPSDVSARARRTQTARHVVLAGAVLGFVLGGLGVGTALSVLAVAPVLLVPLPVLGSVGWWYARRRQGAGGLAATFAFALALAQWPFAAWAVRRAPAGAIPEAQLAVILMVFAGLALAPPVIALVRRQSAGAPV